MRSSMARRGLYRRGAPRTQVGTAGRLRRGARADYEGGGRMPKRQKRVFILGGGAALGAHHVGALRYLEEQGIEPDAIIGSSIGVINACVHGPGGVPQLERAWRGCSSLPTVFAPGVRHKPLVGISFFSMDRLAGTIER